MAWHAVHVYYYADNKDHLMLNGIRPVVEGLRKLYQEQRIFVRRHWKLGPHVALYVDCEQKKFEQECFPYIRDSLQAYLAEFPSTHVLDAEKFIAQSQTLGAWELEPGPYEPLCPDNSVLVQEYKPKLELLNGANTVGIIENFNIASLDVIFQTVEQTGDQAAKRYEWLIKMMAVIAELFPGSDIKKGHMSYRSHVEAYLKTFDKTGQLKTWFDNVQKELTSERIDQWLNSVIQATDVEGIYQGEDPLLREWSLALADMRQATFPLTQTGDIHAGIGHYRQLAENIGDEAVQRWGTEPSVLGMSEFHQQLNSRKQAERFLASPEFATYRVLVNSYYALLPLFGINPHVKHLLCYLVVNSVERVTGFSWRAFFANME